MERNSTLGKLTMSRHIEKAREIVAELEAKGFNPLEIYKVAFHMQFHIEHDHGLLNAIKAAEQAKKEVKDGALANITHSATDTGSD